MQQNKFGGEQLKETFKNFLEGRAYAINTKHTYLKHLNNFEVINGGLDLNQDSIELFLFHKQDDDSQTSGNNHSNGRAFIKAFIDFHCKIFSEDKAQYKLLELPEIKGRQKKKIMTWLTFDEVNRLAVESGRDDLFLIIWLSFFGLLRSCEVIGDKGEYDGIRKKDINFETKRIRIYGKGKKERIVFFYEDIKPVLEDYCADLKPDDKLFDKFGKTRCNAILSDLAATVLQKRGVASHIFRRSGAIFLRKRGWDLEQIRVYGGWESLETLKRYVQASPFELQEKWDKTFVNDN